MDHKWLHSSRGSLTSKTFPRKTPIPIGDGLKIVEIHPGFLHEEIGGKE